MKQILLIGSLIILLACSKQEKNQDLPKPFDTQVLAGDYIGSVNNSIYHQFLVGLTDSSGLAIMDVFNSSVLGYDNEFYAWYINGKFILPFVEIKRNFSDTYGNVIVKKYDYSGDGEMRENPLILSFRINKTVLIGDSVIEQDTLHIEMFRPESTIQMISGIYHQSHDLNDFVQIEKANVPDLILISLNKYPSFGKIRVKAPDLRRYFDFNILQADTLFRCQIEFSKNDIDLHLSRCDTIKDVSDTFIDCKAFYEFRGIME
jgi:hypothetical protein